MKFTQLLSGYTLIEVLVTLAIICTLSIVVFSGYQSIINSKKQSDLESKLMEIMNKQMQFKTINKTYTTDLSELGLMPNGGSVATDQAYYEITPQLCGIQNLNQCIQFFIQDIDIADNQYCFSSFNREIINAINGVC